MAEEVKTCGFEMANGKPCNRELYDDEHCIFHSKDIEGKKDGFNDLFWKEFERQEKKEENFDFSGFVFPGDISFKGKKLIKDVYFYGAQFIGEAGFFEVQFSGDAGFQKAHFSRRAYFHAAQFSEKVNFYKVQFSGVAAFHCTQFSRAALFQNTHFSGKTYFGNAQFYGNADFFLAKFSGDAAFKFAKFSKKASFIGTQFSGVVSFKNSDVRSVDMRWASFHNTDFSGIKYNRHARYRGVHFNNCYGSPFFIRFAKDQEYIEEFRRSKLRWPLYALWLIMADCGRSFGLWAAWGVMFAFLFAVKFFSMGPEAFKVADLPFSFETMIYYSTVTFTTLGFGDITPKTVEAARWVMAEVITGYIMLGGLISILANKLARRS